MVGARVSDVSCLEYELQIEINAPRHRVWEAMLEETNAWWLPDFHMVDAESTVEFDVSPGGRGLIEFKPGGGFLCWYSVQCFMPEQFAIYLVGNIAPDYGGPSTTNMKISLEESGAACVLKISDAHHGKVSEGTVNSLKSGWQQLFGDGLAEYLRK